MKASTQSWLASTTAWMRISRTWFCRVLQSTVQDALAFGSTRLSLGRTALEPKAKMGCKPEPLSCAVRHRVSALNWITTALTRTAEHDEPPERSPFKAAPVDAA